MTKSPEKRAKDASLKSPAEKAATKRALATKRQQAYRERVKKTVQYNVPEQFPETKRVALLEMLSIDLQRIEEPDADPDLVEGAAYRAEQLIGEILVRYRLSPRKPKGARAPGTVVPHRG